MLKQLAAKDFKLSDTEVRWSDDSSRSFSQDLPQGPFQALARLDH